MSAQSSGTVAGRVVGSSPLRIFGLSSEERLRRQLARAGAVATAEAAARIVPLRADWVFDDALVRGLAKSQYLKGQAARFREASLVFVDANLPANTLRTVFSLAGKSHLPVCADPPSTSLAGRLRPYLSRLWMVTPTAPRRQSFVRDLSRLRNEGRPWKPPNACSPRGWESP